MDIEIKSLKDGHKAVFRTTGFEIKDVRNETEMRYWDGIVNGSPIDDESGKGFYVPLWCDREGRENTTIMVHSSNIIAILPSSD